MSKNLSSGGIYQDAQGMEQGHEGLYSSDAWGCDTWNNILGLHEREERYNMLHSTILKWLRSPSPPQRVISLAGAKANEKRYQISQESKLGPEVPGDIVLIQQYYLDDDFSRRAENKLCLLTNSQNSAITKIILLNEKLYSSEELGVNSDKIEQVVIDKRLTYKNVFDYVSDNNINGYIVLANTDIFFDNTLANVMRTGISTSRQMFCQLRFEYESGLELDKCPLFGPRPNSQDAWIWHSNAKTTPKQRKVLDVKLGTPGCDNKIIYLFNLLGFACYNEPYLMKAYHYHESQVRTYDPSTTKSVKPHYYIYPVLPTSSGNHDQHHTFDIIRENDNLRRYVARKLTCGEPFILPRIAGVENEVAMRSIITLRNKDGQQSVNNLVQDLKKMGPTMKCHAGIKFTGIDSVYKYAKMYMAAFHKCEKYFWWEPWGNVGASIPYSLEFMTENFQKPKFDALALDVFNSIASEPWTLALKGKRVLIISPFVESFKEKVDKRTEIYGIDLFPDCELSFIKPPQTQGDSQSDEFDVELHRFVNELEEIKDTYDVALCSCGGYGNLVCSALFDMGKSAIYVGGVLQMYFGVYGERWLREHPDIMRMYMNRHWSRPKNKEIPSGFEKVEDSCYW
jgi:hypothetical protein